MSESRESEKRSAKGHKSNDVRLDASASKRHSPKQARFHGFMLYGIGRMKARLPKLWR